jgi:hypothetical protein
VNVRLAQRLRESHRQTRGVSGAFYASSPLAQKLTVCEVEKEETTSTMDLCRSLFTGGDGGVRGNIYGNNLLGLKLRHWLYLRDLGL